MSVSSFSAAGADLPDAVQLHLYGHLCGRDVDKGERHFVFTLTQRLATASLPIETSNSFPEQADAYFIPYFHHPVCSKSIIWILRLLNVPYYIHYQFSVFYHGLQRSILTYLTIQLL